MKKQTNTFKAILLVLGCLAFLPQLQAVNPPPDGGYPGLNTAEGDNALLQLTSGINNTAVGGLALRDTTTGSYNVAVGSGALRSNTTGAYNMAIGAEALRANNANFNLAIGFRVGFMNTTGTHLTGIGANALFSNTTGGFNTAIGTAALRANTTGSGNTANGQNALLSNISGSNNTAVGNLALGNSTGDFLIAVGANAGTDPDIVSNNVYIGDPGFSGDENVISIGGIAASGTDYQNTFIGGIFGAEVNTGTALPVFVDTDGHLGTSLVNASVKKVTIRSPKGAQPQAKADEFQKQQKRIAELEATVARLVATVKNQAAQIEKVSAQLELQKPARRVVVNKK